MTKTPEETMLARYKAVQSQLDTIRTLPEAKDVHDKAEALRLWAKKAGYDLQTQNEIAETAIWAAWHGGKLLREMAEKDERHKGHGDQKSASRHGSPILKDLGISWNQSSRWQAIAAVDRKRARNMGEGK